MTKFFLPILSGETAWLFWGGGGFFYVEQLCGGLHSSRLLLPYLLNLEKLLACHSTEKAHDPEEAGTSLPHPEETGTSLSHPEETGTSLPRPEETGSSLPPSRFSFPCLLPTVTSGKFQNCRCRDCTPEQHYCIEL